MRITKRNVDKYTVYSIFDDFGQELKCFTVLNEEEFFECCTVMDTIEKMSIEDQYREFIDDWYNRCYPIDIITMNDEILINKILFELI